MKTIYVVTDGEYSDYHVEAIFDDESLARSFVEATGDNMRIEEYELNPHEHSLRDGYAYYQVKMHRNGDVHSVEKTSNITDCKESRSEIEWEHSWYGTDSRKSEYEYSDLDIVLSAFVMGKSEEHAIKIANEYRAHLIATDEWDRREQEMAVWESQWLTSYYKREIKLVKMETVCTRI